jgi:3-dehydroquinate synthase
MTDPTAPETETVSVDLGERGYDIVIGADVLVRAGSLIAPQLARPYTMVVTDETVAALHLDTLGRSLADAGIEHGTIVLPAGEQTKSFAQFESLVERLLAANVERRDAIIAFGGGVIGDLTGFAASVLRRGIDFVQVPTTLLAQVDSSVGGKTAINTRHGKNLVGTFHQPRLVLADTGIIDTLPPRQMLAGYAEVVKYGLIDNPGFFDHLEAEGANLIGGNAALRRQAIAASCRAKARIVAADERETGTRALLNLGHTFGHALEAQTGYGSRLIHGEGVAAGICLAFDLSVRLGHCPPEDAQRVRRHLTTVGLPTLGEIGAGANWRPAALLDHMRQDKKVVDGRMTFVLVRGIGQAFLSSDVGEDDVLAVLTRELTP